MSDLIERLRATNKRVRHLQELREEAAVALEQARDRECKAFHAGMTAGVEGFGRPEFDPAQAWQKYAEDTT